MKFEVSSRDIVSVALGPHAEVDKFEVLDMLARVDIAARLIHLRLKLHIVKLCFRYYHFHFALHPSGCISLYCADFVCRFLVAACVLIS